MKRKNILITIEFPTKVFNTFINPKPKLTNGYKLELLGEAGR